MIHNRTIDKVYLARGTTDLRKSIDGLAAIVQEGFDLDPFSPCLFVFCNRKRDKLKILQWEHNGFWLHYRRLEKGRFPWPDADQLEAMAITERQLRWLLDGLSIEQRHAPPEVSAEKVI
ncbi:IS66 family insertion sequence element accessory protein TnpB [Salipaludibacillus sp. CUR1]|uniref:IS66 family insertion sequence element accessory protein TnpB n=1 Tax=Salipaludibacillus sp. CUR1 TaxID=2820003 RepID=UPI001E476843|nr:IS66 family insertion sequence element accessory protein TnpB [Salipaludibacillus sp. CUR1]MCE7793320.1 IS66 family insertion sequence element accessory protein TnpB [Salipaludibacillus sp. CUR1]